MSTDKAKRVQAKRWCFTLNNYTPEEENRLKELDCEWMIFGHEHQEEGTPHLQGAFVFSGRRDLNRLKKLFPRAHLEVMKGNPIDSRFYCTKEDPTGYFEKGVMPEGRETKGAAKSAKKWEEAVAAAKAGQFEKIPNDMWVRYMNSFKQIYFDNLSDANMESFNDKDLKLHFLWLYGETGTGKSHAAHEIARFLNPDQEPYLKDLNKWWNGYQHQTVTIIDEADPKRCEHLGSYFKKWADKWSFTAECKGAVIPQCRPQYIIVTSNYSISECFPDPHDTVPMERRFTEICLDVKGKKVYWPYTQPEYEAIQKERANQANQAGVESHALPGNTNPEEREQASTRVEPEELPPTQSETGLIEPPATLKRSYAEAFEQLQGEPVE